jgi:hypothetical protein
MLNDLELLDGVSIAFREAIKRNKGDINCKTLINKAFFKGYF